MNPSTITITEFKKIIWSHYRQHGRTFDWRHADDPYCVFISEVMLQQTQTARVAYKYAEFMTRFPTLNSLASASLKDVLNAWQGLGYNRRGMYLHNAAQEIVQNYNGIIPNDPELLVQLPGIGKATAASICAFAFNSPTVFIETNIRTVFIHFFFSGQEKVHDKDIALLVQETVDPEHARDWYYALMDYGVMLKKAVPNPSRKSAHHAKQSKFEGSDRQIRGMIIKLLAKQQEPIAKSGLIELIAKDSARVETIISQLIAESLVQSNDQSFWIA
jgi:A/G-specific adenine glycosylase